MLPELAAGPVASFESDVTLMILLSLPSRPFSPRSLTSSNTIDFTGLCCIFLLCYCYESNPLLLWTMC